MQPTLVSPCPAAVASVTPTAADVMIGRPVSTEPKSCSTQQSEAHHKFVPALQVGLPRCRCQPASASADAKQGSFGIGRSEGDISADDSGQLPVIQPNRLSRPDMLSGTGDVHSSKWEARCSIPGIDKKLALSTAQQPVEQNNHKTVGTASAVGRRVFLLILSFALLLLHHTASYYASGTSVAPLCCPPASSVCHLGLGLQWKTPAPKARWRLGQLGTLAPSAPALDKTPRETPTTAADSPPCGCRSPCRTNLALKPPAWRCRPAGPSPTSAV